MSHPRPVENVVNNIEPRHRYPREGELPIRDILQGLENITPEEFHALGREEKQRVVSKLREVFSAPALRKILDSGRGDEFAAHKALDIRKALQIDKWSDLASTVFRPT